LRAVFVGGQKWFVAFRRFHQLQLRDVARERGLGDSQFHLCQPPPQFVLARNSFARDQFEYLSLPEPFLACQSLTCRPLCI
jgi:hypothetical protein